MTRRYGHVNIFFTNAGISTGSGFLKPHGRRCVEGALENVCDDLGGENSCRPILSQKSISLNVVVERYQEHELFHADGMYRSNGSFLWPSHLTNCLKARMGEGMMSYLFAVADSAESRVASFIAIARTDSVQNILAEIREWCIQNTVYSV